MTTTALDPEAGGDLGLSSAGTHRAVVLLVDDQATVAEAVRQMLAGEDDLEFHYCPDPSRAIATAKEIGATVVLQDLVMPTVDGLTVVRFLRAGADTRGIPIVVLSSKEHPLDKSAAFAAGATDYLVKLPDKIELVARIRAHSRTYRLQQQRDEAYRSLRAMKRQLEESNEVLRKLTMLDGLTGIANRRRFDEVLGLEWRRAQRAGVAVGLILIDIDHFKMFNDTLGHLRGDECLRQVAETLQAGVRRPADLVARYGGEEFVALLPDSAASGARDVAERLREQVEALGIPHGHGSVGRVVTISAGVATARPAPDLAPEGLIRNADAALYQAKHEGRNRVQLHPESVG